MIDVFKTLNQKFLEIAKKIFILNKRYKKKETKL